MPIDNGLPGFDPTFEPAGPQLPVGGVVESTGQPAGLGGREKLALALKLILPAIAAISSRGQGFGGFMQGFMGGEQQQAESADRLVRRQMEEEQVGLQRDRVQREIAAQARAQAAEERRQADVLAQRAAEAKAEQEKKIHDTISRALDKASMNPGFMQKVNSQGAQNFSLSVPGLGSVNLKDAFGRLGVVQDIDGNYVYGAVPPVHEEELVPTPGPDGAPVYGEKKKGARVYERPRAPREQNEDLVPTPGPDGPVYGKKKEGAPVYERPQTGKRRTGIRALENPDEPGEHRLYLVDLDTGEIIKEVKAPTTAAPPGGAGGGPPVKGKIGRFLVEPG